MSRPFGAALQGDRDEQQDAFRVLWLAGEQAWLLVVADGMGGHAAGETASRTAADGFASAFLEQRSKAATLEQALTAALDHANARIAAVQRDHPEMAGMGTTLLAAHLSPKGLAWISVGDSPLWIYRRGRLQRLNEDHSLRDLIGKGERAGRNRAAANMLVSALTGQPIPAVDCRAKPLRLAQDELIVAASDGVLTLEEDEIARAIADSGRARPEAVVRRLMKAVADRAKPGQDNCTVVVAPALPGGRWPSAKLALAALAAAALALAAGYWLL